MLPLFVTGGPLLEGARWRIDCVPPNIVVPYENQSETYRIVIAFSEKDKYSNKIIPK
jgi:hypothetical protein